MMEGYGYMHGGFGWHPETEQGLVVVHPETIAADQRRGLSERRALVERWRGPLFVLDDVRECGAVDADGTAFLEAVDAAIYDHADRHMRARIAADAERGFTPKAVRVLLRLAPDVQSVRIVAVDDDPWGNEVANLLEDSGLKVVVGASAETWGMGQGGMMSGSGTMGGGMGGGCAFFRSFNAGQELRSGLREGLSEYDADDDGTLSIDVFEAMHSAAIREVTVDRFQILEADGDGQVTEAEIEAPVARMERMQRLRAERMERMQSSGGQAAGPASHHGGSPASE